MPKLTGLKIFIYLIGILVIAWNYFLRNSINLPYLSTLGITTTYIIGAGIILIGIIISYSTRNSF